jgi:hypothetical protein
MGGDSNGPEDCNFSLHSSEKHNLNSNKAIDCFFSNNQEKNRRDRDSGKLLVHDDDNVMISTY